MRSKLKLGLRKLALLGLGGLSALGGSCQHFSFSSALLQEPVVLSAREAVFFAPCSPAEGGLILSWRGRAGAEPLVQAGFEWLAAAGDSWQAQLYDPLGRSLLELRWDNQAQHWQMQGPLRSKVAGLSISKQGFLQAEGHFLGLKASELPCLLAGKLPETWAALVKDRVQVSAQTAQQGAATSLLFAEDAQRQLRLQLELNPPANPQASYRACVLITWPLWWGLLGDRAISFCLSDQQRGRLYLGKQAWGREQTQQDNPALMWEPDEQRE